MVFWAASLHKGQQGSVLEIFSEFPDLVNLQAGWLRPCIRHANPKLSMAGMSVFVHKTACLSYRAHPPPNSSLNFGQILEGEYMQTPVECFLGSSSKPRKEERPGGKFCISPDTVPVLLWNSYSWVKAKNVRQMTRMLLRNCFASLKIT